ncbi:hypothetical protein IV203_008484 [Nitzschia inconspicua]|uniref:Uncharacterized protein n=1 Tax=Nitzschia inconspicua TaxID=303405 RepID=A0A9K3PMQ9_9STRA|nr:hypothetical protein IV203_008484 [Nitzschia inconspicua]
MSTKSTWKRSRKALDMIGEAAPFSGLITGGLRMQVGHIAMYVLTIFCVMLQYMSLTAANVACCLVCLDREAWQSRIAMKTSRWGTARRPWKNILGNFSPLGSVTTSAV